MKLKKGFFITLEGGEGSGKSTILSRLESFFKEKDIDFLSTREPGGTRIGEEIRKIVLEFSAIFSSRCELSLYLASRAQHVEEIILPALKEKKLVLCDRFHESSVAYQGYARGLDPESVYNSSLFMAQNLIPDLTIYLDVDPKIGLSRRKKTKNKWDRLDQESLSFHQKVREGYLLLLKKYPNRIVAIDSSKTLEEILKESIKLILERINNLLA